MCCIGAANLGPGGCTCWESVHDQFQAAPDLGSEPTDRDVMCADCAFKPGSPEHTGVDAAAYDADDLAMLVATDAPFWCHQGMRLITALRHPSGAVKPLPGNLAYDPPIVNGVPYQADGTAGQGCAGLAARRRSKAITVLG